MEMTKCQQAQLSITAHILTARTVEGLADILFRRVRGSRVSSGMAWHSWPTAPLTAVSVTQWVGPSWAHVIWGFWGPSHQQCPPLPSPRFISWLSFHCWLVTLSPICSPDPGPDVGDADKHSTRRESEAKHLKCTQSLSCLHSLLRWHASDQPANLQ